PPASRPADAQHSIRGQLVRPYGFSSFEPSRQGLSPGKRQASLVALTTNLSGRSSAGAIG
ncbi:MAG: hypothetical protein ACRESZ_09925, partial [Methylococcales bacterium]